MQKIVFYTLFLLQAAQSKAQQLPLFTQYREYHSVLNPATISSDYITDQYTAAFGASVRTQWVAIDRNPKTQILRGEYFIPSGGNFHLITGGYLMNDQTGATGFTGAYGRVAVLASADPSYSGVAMGLSIGATQFRLSTDNIIFAQGAEGIQNYRQIYPDLSIGIFGYGSLSDKGNGGDNILYGGVSVPQLLGLNLNFRSEQNKEFSVQRIAHYYALVGYYKYIGENSLIEPSAWLRYVKGAPIGVDFNLRGQLSSTIWLGAGFSTTRVLHTEIGFLMGENLGLDNFRVKIGYGFDHAFNTVAPYFGTTHEVNLSILLGSQQQRY
jgi:type IX secretion system PorP/SprF family membrane protein